MKNPAILVSRHPRLHERSSAAWGLEIVLQLYGKRTALRYPFQRRQSFPEDEFAPLSIAEIHAMGIETEVRPYGAAFARFEADLRKCPRNEPAGFPLVRIPAIAQVDWETAGMHIRPCTFIVGEESGLPVFLTRSPRSPTVGKVTLEQLRFLHDSWRQWPAVLPSMLFTVLWHRGSRE